MAHKVFGRRPLNRKLDSALNGRFTPEESKLKAIKLVAPQGTDESELMELIEASLKMIGAVDFTVEEIKYLVDGQIESPFGTMDAAQYLVTYRSELLH